MANHRELALTLARKQQRRIPALPRSLFVCAVDDDAYITESSSNLERLADVAVSVAKARP